MRVITPEPGLLHVFIDAEELFHIQVHDACGQWLTDVVLTAREDQQEETGRHCEMQTFLRPNPNTP